MEIKGVNLGSWLLMEGYILGGKNIPESLFKKRFMSIYGAKELKKFEDSFRKNFIVKDDFKKIAQMGAKCIRVPFNYRLLETRPYGYSEEGFKHLDRVFSWADEFGLGVILDLHAAQGAQNCDWHADSSGQAFLWQDKKYRERVLCLWERIADRFKEEPSLVGYDVLNEPVLGKLNINI